MKSLHFYTRIQLLSKPKSEKQNFKSMFERVTYLNIHPHNSHVIDIASIHLKIHFIFFLDTYIVGPYFLVSFAVRFGHMAEL